MPKWSYEQAVVLEESSKFKGKYIFYYSFTFQVHLMK